MISVASVFQVVQQRLPAVFVSVGNVVSVWKRVCSIVVVVMILFLVLIVGIKLICRIVILFH